MTDIGSIDSKPPEIPTFDELMWPMLTALKELGGSGTNEEILAKVVELEGYSPEVQAYQHSDNRQTKINYNLAWAKTYLKKVGAVENSSRGIWSLTKLGERFTQAEVAAVPARVRRKFVNERRSSTVSVQSEVPALPVEAEELEVAEPHWKDSF